MEQKFHEEISANLEIPENAARSIRHRKLRTLLREFLVEWNGQLL